MSDPTMMDSDGDGLLDDVDPSPLKYATSHTLKDKDKQELRIFLTNQIENDIAPTTNAKRLYSNNKCINIVYQNDDKITEISNKYDMPKSYIQSILLRELYCYGIDDPIGDLGFKNYCQYIRDCEFYANQSELYQSFVPFPPQPIIIQEDSSTGIGQITTRTAIKANNWAVEKGYKNNKIVDILDNREKMFYNLQNNNYNLDMIALVLMSEWYDNKDYIQNYSEKYWGFSDEHIKTLFSIYNCGETVITGYGEAVYNLYEIFREYE